jgi:hypothetical protein
VLAAGVDRLTMLAGHNLRRNRTAAYQRRQRQPTFRHSVVPSRRRPAGASDGIHSIRTGHGSSAAL